MALNQIILMGRLVREPETRFLQGTNNSVTKFTLAVDREYKAANEDKPKTDYINCAAWNKTGEFVAKYFRQGSMILVIGSLELDSYTGRDGNKVYTTEVRVTKAHFTGEKRESQGDINRTPEVPEGYFNPTSEDEFMNIPDGVENGLPFN